MLEQFEKCLKRVNFYLGLFGLGLGKRDRNKSISELVRSHWMYIAHFFSLNLELIAQILWILEAIIAGKKFVEITRLIPCLVICIVSLFKTLSIIYYGHSNNEFIETMKRVLLNQIDIGEEGNDGKRKEIIDSHVLMLKKIVKKGNILILLGVALFIFAPVFTILQEYVKTFEIKLELPFIAYYPFNEFDIRIYPWVYLHQCFSGFQAILMVYGPDCFFFTSCTFLDIQFLLLCYDLERIVDEDSHGCCRPKLKKLAVCHIELMRCVKLLEKIFTNTILFNALISSILICVNGFNVLVVDNIILMASFTAFFIFGLIEIFLYCYYGDTIMRSSMQVSDAIYNSQWYKAGVVNQKEFLTVMIRAQTPCELSAKGFFKINLAAFTSILSTSWSYFCLLTTMYHPE